ncbi:hypothetical protein EASAB2608_07146 [Streptomyces sp. EAS-AB2608]|nr:hypothetical protein EASAB2608_07146 [Streptomyces sp. EAS-AB2608]
MQRRASPDGCRRAIEAHRHAARPSRADPAIAEAVERQTTAMRERDRHACPKPDIAPIEQARTQRRRQPWRLRPLPCTGPIQSWTHSRSQPRLARGRPRAGAPTALS